MFKFDGEHNVSQTADPESRVIDEFDSGNIDGAKKCSDTLVPTLERVDDNTLVSNVKAVDTFEGFSPMRINVSCTSHLDEHSMRSPSRISQAPARVHRFFIKHPQQIVRVHRSIPTSVAKDLPRAILKRMAYDTATSTLKFCSPSSFLETALSGHFNSHNHAVEQNTSENIIGIPFPLDSPNCTLASTRASAPTGETPHTAASLAPSRDLFFDITTSTESVVPHKVRPSTCPEQIVSGSRIDEMNFQSFASYNGNFSASGLMSNFIEPILEEKISLQTTSDGLNVGSLEGADMNTDKLAKPQRLRDSHLIKMLVPELLSTSPQHETVSQSLSPDWVHSPESMGDRNQNFYCDRNLLAKMPGSFPPSHSKLNGQSCDKFTTTASRLLDPAFCPKTPGQFRKNYDTHRLTYTGANNAMTRCILNHSKKHNKRVPKMMFNSKDEFVCTSSLGYQKTTSPIHIERFQTWPFPTLFKSSSSPFQSPSEEALFINSKGNVVESSTMEGVRHAPGKESKCLGLSFPNPLPTVDFQLDYASKDMDERSFSHRLEFTHNTQLKPSHIHNDSSTANRCAIEDGQNASLRLLGSNSGVPSEGNEMDPFNSRTINNTEFLRTCEMIYSAYMGISSIQRGDSRRLDTSSFDNNRISQQNGIGVQSICRKCTPKINHIDSNKQTYPYSIATPSASVSGPLGRSAGYYSFGNHLSLHHPNYQKVGFTPQYLGSFSNAQSPSENSKVHTTVKNVQTDAKLLNQEKSHLKMDPIVIARIQRRPLLLATVFLRHTCALLRESIRGNLDSNNELENDSLLFSSNLKEVRDVLTISEGGTQANRSLNMFPNNSDVEPNFKQADNSDSSSPVLTKCVEQKDVKEGAVVDNPMLLTIISHCSSLDDASGDIDENTKVDCKSGKSHMLRGKAMVSRGEAISEPFSTTRDSPQPAFSFTTPLEHQYRPPLTPYVKVMRHRHSIDNIEREVDNESNDLIVHVGTRLMGWLEVIALLGSGSFGQVFLCSDLRISSDTFVHPSEIGGEDFGYWSCSHVYLPFGDCDIPPTHSPLVAVKVVKSIPLFEQQSILEAEMLVLIGVQTAAVDPPQGASAMSQTENSSLNPPPPDPRCNFVGKVLAHGVCYGHHCIVMERYGANLYEYIRSRQYNGLPMYQIQSIAKQLLSALTLLHENCHIIHADIKPENLLLTLDSCYNMPNINYVRQYSQNLKKNIRTATDTCVEGRDAGEDCATGHNNEEACYVCQKKMSVRLRNSIISLGSANSTVISPSLATSCKHYAVNNCVDSKIQLELSTEQNVKQPSSIQTPPKEGMVLSKSERFDRCTHIPQQRQSLDGLYKAVTSPVYRSRSATSFIASLHNDASLTIPRLQIKLIDFSSSCYDAGPFYSYIQSRYYRAPEVIVNAGYGPSIDLWSTGCVLAELLLGMPLLPGCNDHHQLTLIEEMLGPLPLSLLESGDTTDLYYDKKFLEGVDIDQTFSEGRSTCTESPSVAISQPHNLEPNHHISNASCKPSYSYKLITRDDFLARRNLPAIEYKRYFTCRTLQDLVRQCPLSSIEKRMSYELPPYSSPSEATDVLSDAKLSETVCNELLRQRFLLYDLLRQLLNTDPMTRLTASQALSHPFFSYKFTYMQKFELE